MSLEFSANLQFLSETMIETWNYYIHAIVLLPVRCIDVDEQAGISTKGRRQISLCSTENTEDSQSAIKDKYTSVKKILKENNGDKASSVKLPNETDIANKICFKKSTIFISVAQISSDNIDQGTLMPYESRAESDNINRTPHSLNPPEMNDIITGRNGHIINNVFRPETETLFESKYNRDYKQWCTERDREQRKFKTGCIRKRESFQNDTALKCVENERDRERKQFMNINRCQTNANHLKFNREQENQQLIGNWASDQKCVISGSEISIQEIVCENENLILQSDNGTDKEQCNSVIPKSQFYFHEIILPKSSVADSKKSSDLLIHAALLTGTAEEPVQQNTAWRQDVPKDCCKLANNVILIGSCPKCSEIKLVPKSGKSLQRFGEHLHVLPEQLRNGDAHFKDINMTEKKKRSNLSKREPSNSRKVTFSDKKTILSFNPKESIYETFHRSGVKKGNNKRRKTLWHCPPTVKSSLKNKEAKHQGKVKPRIRFSEGHRRFVFDPEESIYETFYTGQEPEQEIKNEQHNQHASIADNCPPMSTNFHELEIQVENKRNVEFSEDSITQKYDDREGISFGNFVHWPPICFNLQELEVQEETKPKLAFSEDRIIQKCDAEGIFFQNNYHRKDRGEGGIEYEEIDLSPSSVINHGIDFSNRVKATEGYTNITFETEPIADFLPVFRCGSLGEANSDGEEDESLLPQRNTRAKNIIFGRLSEWSKNVKSEVKSWGLKKWIPPQLILRKKKKSDKLMK